LQLLTFSFFLFFRATRCRPHADFCTSLHPRDCLQCKCSSTGFRGGTDSFEVPRAQNRCGSLHDQKCESSLPGWAVKIRNQKKRAAFTGNSSQEEGFTCCSKLLITRLDERFQTFSSFTEYNVECIKRPPTHHTCHERFHPDYYIIIDKLINFY
jgi:hypothetical protein